MANIKKNYISRVRYAFVITLLLGIATLLSPFKVMADVNAKPTLAISCNSADYNLILTSASDINTSAGFTFITVSASTQVGNTSSCNVSLDMTTYKNYEQSVKTSIMESALTTISNSSMSTMSRNKLYNFIESQDESTASLVRQLSNDVNADFAEAYMMFKPFSGVLGVILGVFAIVIFVTLTMMILVDLSYIVIPMIRDFLTPSSANAKPKFVSNEAWYAVKEVDGANDTQKNVLLIYLKKKTMQFVALSICILYLLSGEIYILIGNLMDMFRGVLG